MSEVEIILTLLLVVAALVALAGKLRVPYPIFLVLGGAALGFLPQIPDVVIDPGTVFLIFIPPLVYSAAFFTSLRDFVANARPILLLAVGLVIVSTVVVAGVAHVVVGLAWAPAFVLGSVVSNTDTAATVAIADQVRLPRRILTILEGESLINDAVGLTAFRIAIATTVSGVFSSLDIGGDFALAVLGAIPIGLAVGWLSVALRARTTDTNIEGILSVLTPYAAYLPADQIGASGILAVVIAGLYVGRRESMYEDAVTRLQLRGVWNVGLFVLNGLLFILVGLQLPAIWEGLVADDTGEILRNAAVIGLTVVVIRIVWVFTSAGLAQWLGTRGILTPTIKGWRPVAIVSWAGLRGADTLAAALSVPLLTASGAAFPFRAEIIFFAFAVIAVTLVGQGLTLPRLIHWLRVTDDNAEEEEEIAARRAASDAALARIDELAREDGVATDVIDLLRRYYGHEAELLAGGDGAEHSQNAARQEIQLRREVVEAERVAVLQLRDQGAISDDVMRRVQRDLDLEEARFVRDAV
jgi:CPA1 family monovalent cation:H+ antiporter